MNRLIIAGLFLLTCADLYAQCDCPGNVPPPMIVISGPINNGRIMPSHGEASATISYRYSMGDKLSSGDAKQNNIFQREYHHNYLGVYANYAISSDWNLAIETAYFNAKVKDVYANNDYSQFSHFTISNRYNLLSRDSDDELIANFGIKIPLNGNDLDTTGLAKPANSTYGFNIGSIYNLMLNSDMNLLISANYDLNLANGNGTKVGDAVYTQVMCRYNNLEKFSPSIALTADYRMRDKYKETQVQNSGGYSLNIVPAVSYSIESISTSLNLSTTIPLYRYYEGYQSGQNFAVQFGISFGF